MEGKLGNAVKFQTLDLEAIIAGAGDSVPVILATWEAEIRRITV
jgi:hypothetical protein